MSAYNIQTPGKFPEDYTLYSHQSESLKTTIMYNGFDASKLFSVFAGLFQTARHRLLKIIGTLHDLLLYWMCFNFRN
jgi:hypothetical protein